MVIDSMSAGYGAEGMQSVVQRGCENATNRPYHLGIGVGGLPYSSSSYKPSYARFIYDLCAMFKSDIYLFPLIKFEPFNNFCKSLDLLCNEFIDQFCICYEEMDCI